MRRLLLPGFLRLKSAALLLLAGLVLAGGAAIVAWHQRMVLAPTPPRAEFIVVRKATAPGQGRKRVRRVQHPAAAAHHI